MPPAKVMNLKARRVMEKRMEFEVKFYRFLVQRFHKQFKKLVAEGQCRLWVVLIFINILKKQMINYCPFLINTFQVSSCNFLTTFIASLSVLFMIPKVSTRILKSISIIFLWKKILKDLPIIIILFRWTRQVFLKILKFAYHWFHFSFSENNTFLLQFSNKMLVQGLVCPLLPSKNQLVFRT